MEDQMLTLTISHNIFLTRDQRYLLTNKESIEVIGVSVPVWFYKGNTSEPAKDIFCKYILTNDSKSDPIMPLKEGYKINLPIKVEDSSVEKRLLDITDGGTECLFYREYNKVYKPTQYDLIHFVQIMPIEMMEKTLTL